MAATVLVGVLNGSDKEDESEWEDGGTTAEDGELGKLVEDGDGEEVDVGKAAELLEKVAGNESEK